MYLGYVSRTFFRNVLWGRKPLFFKGLVFGRRSGKGCLNSLVDSFIGPFYSERLGYTGQDEYGKKGNGYEVVRATLRMRLGAGGEAEAVGDQRQHTVTAASSSQCFLMKRVTWELQ